MATSIFGIATSGIAAARAGLATTAHNVANVNTEGFSRQHVVQTTPVPAYSGAGYLGAGVAVQTVRRAWNELLATQARAAESRATAAAELAARLRTLDDLVADPQAGLAPALQAFFGGLNELAAHPADSAARHALVARAEALAARLRGLDARMTELRARANRQIEESVAEVNAAAARIAELNRRILEAASVGARTQPPNDLLDERDRLLRALAREVGATAVAQSDGSLNVFVGGGGALVVGANAYRLAARPDPEWPQNVAVVLEAGAVPVALRAADLAGGRLGAIVEFRDTDLAGARAALGRIAIALAAQVNDRHRLGQDLDGAPGAAFFAVAAPQVAARATNAGDAELSATLADASALRASAYRVLWDGAAWQVERLADGTRWSFATLPQTVDGVTLALAAGTPAAGDSFRIEPTAAGAAEFALLVREPRRIAAALPIRAASAPANAGSATVAALAVDGPPPPDPNLAQTVTITFTGPNTFDVSGVGTGDPSGLAYTSGAPIRFNGWTLAIAGAPAAGDVFVVEANAGGIGDNRNALALAALQSARGIEAGAATYGEAWSALVGAVGSRARELQVNEEALGRLAAHAEADRQTLSGVNLDEEAANLLRYQQAWQASAKALAVAEALFATLLELGGR
ncbi:MAG: flagellar hook-associated protein FlgK [Burkholderiales bacterium]|nr:flagellar hook-associated protein FlgK [Burkholderiales bacterium]